MSQIAVHFALVRADAAAGRQELLRLTAAFACRSSYAGLHPTAVTGSV